VLSGDPTAVKLVLERQGVDISIKDESSFDDKSSPAEIRSRAEEFCPHIPATAFTRGATPLHYACLVGNWDIIKLVLEAGAWHDEKDNDGKTPLEYFDTRRTDLEVFEAYHKELIAWRRRIRALNPRSTSFEDRNWHTDVGEQCQKPPPFAMRYETETMNIANSELYFTVI
jgi:ATP-dependent Clp protease ATP-binding subunit ClpB